MNDRHPDFLQRLESRRLLSGTASVRDGALFVDGTSAADQIAFNASPDFIRVTINANTTAVDATGVRAIRVNGLDGDDVIVLGKKLRLGAVIFGGDGNDTIGGGPLNDTILGGAGDDHLSGRRGNDYMEGNAGDDVLTDYLGRNVFHGGSGNDSALMDSFLLGSGVESRREAIVRTGVVTSVDIYDVPSIGQQSGSHLYRENGRLILDYFGETGSVSNSVSFSQLKLRKDGLFEVQVIVTTPPFGTPSLAAIKNYSNRWDITDAQKSGLVFVFETIVPPSPSGDVPQTIRRHGSLFLLPS